MANTSTLSAGHLIRHGTNGTCKKFVENINFTVKKRSILSTFHGFMVRM